MSDNGISREELRAHLDLIEEKSQRRTDSIDAKIDRLSDAVERLAVTVTDARNEGKADNKTTRSTVVVTAIGSTLAVISIVATIVWGAVQIVNATQGTMTTALGNAIAAMSVREQAPTSPAPAPTNDKK